MSKIITALFAGIAIGILVAPRKGSETRKKIRDGISDMRDDINDFLHDTAENIRSGLSAAEGQADDFLQRGKDQFSSLGKKFWSAGRNSDHPGLVPQNQYYLVISSATYCA